MFYRVGTSNCRPHIFKIYSSILLFRLHKCNILLDGNKNKVITSVEFDIMKRTYTELSEISFTEAVVRCVWSWPWFTTMVKWTTEPLPTPLG